MYGHLVCRCEGAEPPLLPHTSLHWRSTDYCIHKDETLQNHTLDAGEREISNRPTIMGVGAKSF